ncbi:hypothetical protein COBT_000966 [Conglomerata obtusa]
MTHIMKKIDSLTLSVKRIEKEHFIKKDIVCRNCGHRGHISQYCKNKRTLYQDTSNENNLNKNDIWKERTDVQEIEKLLGRKVKGTVKDFKNTFQPMSKELKNILNIIPEHFSIRTTLFKNEILVYELKKILKTHSEKKANTLMSDENTQKFYILKANMKIFGKLIETVIDTGANFSVISRQKAEELNLPVCKQNFLQIKIANSDTVD